MVLPTRRATVCVLPLLCASVAVSPLAFAGNQKNTPYDYLQLLAPDELSPGDWFGVSVGIDGLLAITGAKQDDDLGSDAGAAYVFEVLTGTQLFKLTAEDGSAGDNLGSRVAISGTLALVGSIKDDAPANNSGSAYVFDLVTGQQLQKLVAIDGAASDFFGGSVGIDDETAIVGAYSDDPGGSAYLFNAMTGQHLHKLVGLDTANNDWFGSGVAISGQIAIVGSSRDDDGGNDAGSAYAFNIATGEQLYKLVADDANAGDRFGEVLAIDGAVIVVGARFSDGVGAAYVFDAKTGIQIYKLVAGDADAGDQFGWSVEVTDSFVLIGAGGDDNLAGAAYLFDLATGQQLLKIVAPSRTAGERLGVRVSLSGTFAMIGALWTDGAAVGTAYLMNADCNASGTGDFFDIYFGDTGDANGNLTPDECECLADLDDSGDVGIGDFLLVLAQWGPCPPACFADIDGDGEVGILDFLLVLASWGPCT